jgi:antitoxin component HigA of HigAB toxin-antitoxin module
MLLLGMSPMSSNNGYIDHPAKLLSSGQTVLFRSPTSEIRRERTGTHAKVGVFLGVDGQYTLLEVHSFNVGRMEERTKLANAAHKALDGISADEYPSQQLRHDLSVYCSTLWDTHLTPLVAQKVAGDAVADPTTFVIDPYIIHGGGTIMFAPPGRGKSYTALLMTVAVDDGNAVLFQARKRRAMFINLERSADSIVRRLGSVNTALGLDPARELVVLNARGKSLQDISEIARRSIDEHGIEFITLDSISRAGHGDLNENKPVNDIVDTLNQLAPTWLGLAHTPRADESHVFGSVHFEAGADVVVRMLSEKTDTALGIGLKITKANDVGPKPIMAVRYLFDEYGLTSATRTTLNEFPGMRSENVSLVDEILSYLTHEAGSATATEIATELGKSRSRISEVLNADKRFIKLPREGRAVQYGVASKP